MNFLQDSSRNIFRKCFKNSFRKSLLEFLREDLPRFFQEPFSRNFFQDSSKILFRESPKHFLLDLRTSFGITPVIPSGIFSRTASIFFSATPSRVPRGILLLWIAPGGPSGILANASAMFPDVHSGFFQDIIRMEIPLKVLRKIVQDFIVAELLKELLIKLLGVVHK